MMHPIIGNYQSWLYFYFGLAIKLALGGTIDKFFSLFPCFAYFFQLVCIQRKENVLPSIYAVNTCVCFIYFAKWICIFCLTFFFWKTQVLSFLFWKLSKIHKCIGFADNRYQDKQNKTCLKTHNFFWFFLKHSMTFCI